MDAYDWCRQSSCYRGGTLVVSASRMQTGPGLRGLSERTFGRSSSPAACRASRLRGCSKIEPARRRPPGPPRALGEVSPRSKTNRVSHRRLGVRRSGLREWHADGPLGLQQNLTIARAPSNYPAGALTLSMALSGNSPASLAAGGKSITRDPPRRAPPSLQRPASHRCARARTRLGGHIS